MKKQLISILMSAALVATLFVGCAAEESTEVATETEVVTEEVVEATEEVTEEATEESAAVEAVDTSVVYVTPEWVKSVIDGEQAESADYIILECSWGGEEYSPSYTTGHIPGAVHMNTDDIEEEVYWNVRSAEEIEALFSEYGITKDTTVICYSEDATWAPDDRVAFVALWAGVENVKCLDGGLEAYIAAGYELETESNDPSGAGTEFGTEIPVHPEYILSMEETLEKLESDDDFALVSIRSYDEYLGTTSGYSYIDRAGEPEGAVWGHDTDDGSYMAEDGTTVGIDVVSEYLAESGVTTDNELSFYCGTGWRATIPFLICYENGVENISLYDGGWFQWQMNDDMPVQIGDPASDDCIYTTVSELSTDMAK